MSAPTAGPPAAGAGRAVRVAVTHAGDLPVPPLWAVTVPPCACALVDSGWPAPRTQVVKASGLSAKPGGAAGKLGGLVTL